MPDSIAAPFENELPPIDLRNPYLAGFLAWLVPGLGHCYQRRYHKALLFFFCIVPMFIAGCVLTSGSPEVGTVRSTYWSWRSGDMRLWWLVHAPLGIVAIPSWTQAWQVNSGQSPMLGRFMAPPQRYPGDPTGVPPVIDELRQKLPYYELGNYLLVFAGLMNLLVIFDAVDGPFAGRRKMVPQA